MTEGSQQAQTLCGGWGRAYGEHSTIPSCKSFILEGICPRHWKAHGTEPLQPAMQQTPQLVSVFCLFPCSLGLPQK